MEEIDLTFTKEELAIIILCIRGYRSYSSDGDSQTQEANRCAASAVLEVLYDIPISDKEIVQKYIDLENKIDKAVPQKDFSEDELKASTAFSKRAKPHLSIVRS